MRMLWHKFKNSYFSKYVFVGIMNVAVSYIFFVLLIWLGLQYVIASLIAYILAVANSYLWSKFFTFQTRQKNLGEAMRFFIVYGMQYAINLSGLILFVEIFKFGPILAQSIVLIASTLISFFGHKYWTFKIHRHADEQGS